MLISLSVSCLSVSLSRTACRRVRVLAVEEWERTGFQYDLISCLNLLDRCETPLDLLKGMQRSLVPGTGRVILALVLPFQPYVEIGVWKEKADLTQLAMANHTHT